MSGKGCRSRWWLRVTIVLSCIVSLPSPSFGLSSLMHGLYSVHPSSVYIGAGRLKVFGEQMAVLQIFTAS